MFLENQVDIVRNQGDIVETMVSSRGINSQPPKAKDPKVLHVISVDLFQCNIIFQSRFCGSTQFLLLRFATKH